MTTIKWLSEEELENSIITSLNNIVVKEGFVNHKKTIRSITTNGGNYLGDLFVVDIKETSTDEEKELNLFIKQIKYEGIPTFIQPSGLQDREILVYNKLATFYTKLMNATNIPEDERYQQVKCYDTTDKFIILENMVVKGYETLERTTPLTFSFAELAIKQLAKFHALSFLLQLKEPKYFNENIKVLKSPMEFTSDYFEVMEDIFDMSCELLDENKEKILRSASEKILNVEKYYGVSSSRKCLCHGDFRTNNMLIKQENGQIIDLLPVDFQIIQYSNPMNDFWYLIIPHSDREFRRKHLTTLKELYYDTLTQFLKYFDIDVSSVYPRQEFEDDYKEKTIFGLFSSISLLPFLFAEEDAVPEFEDMSSFKSKTRLQGSAKERIQGIVDDYIEWAII